MRGRAAVGILCATLVSWLAAPLQAQTVTGTIEGTVTDTTHAPLSGVRVSIGNLETGQAREAVTSERGYYVAAFLPLGRYRVSASFAGFGTVTRDAVEVSLNATRVIDFRLDPRVKEEIVVSAASALINTTNQEIKQSLSAEQILEKPTFQNLNNNNTFLTLAETFAGFQENPTSGQNNPTASSGSSINFNGTGTRGATFQIDGVSNDDSSENQHRQGVNLASIKEFQVISNSYSAEFGRGFGAVVLVQTKSGTNGVKGELYYGRQDSDWNARSFFSLTKPANARNNYGGVVGFPIQKNKLFGFVSFDRGRQQGGGTYTRDIFTAAEKQLPRLTRDNDTPANRAFVESVLARFGNLQPNDPRSNRTYQGTAGFDRPVTDASARLDWDATRSDHVVLRYQYSRQKFDNEDVIVGEATQQNNRQGNIGLTWTHAFSARTVAEFRYGYGIRDTNVNIKAGNDTPIIRFSPTPVASSIIGNAGGFPITRDQVDHQFVYNVNTLFGNSHSFKAGADVRFSRLDDLAQSFQRPFYTFTTSCAGTTYPSPWAALLDGCVTTFQRSYGPFFLENRIKEYNLYAEDNWKLRPNLTLNLGVRYEYAGAPTEKANRLSYGFSDDSNNVEPRVGFAFSPDWKQGLLGWLAGGGPGSFSLRGGYGLYHGRIFQTVFSQTGASIRTNPPNAASLTVTNNLNLADPTGGFVLTPGEPTTRVTLTKVDPDLEMPRTHQWNLTLERKLFWSSTLRLTYSGIRGKNLRYTLDNLPVSPLAGGIVVPNHPFNAPAAGFPDLRGVRIDRIAADVDCAGTGLPGIPTNATCPVAVPIANNEISRRVPRTNERRPDPRYTTNLVVSADANTWYNGLQTSWEKRVTKGLRFEISYTWSKALDDTSEATFVGAGDSNNLGPDKRYARGLSRFNTPHRFAFNGTWLLPVLRDRKDWVGGAFGGWQLSAVVKLAHGTPFTVTDSAGGDLNFDGFSENRPVVVNPGVLGAGVDHPDRSTSQLPRDAFRRATLADFGGEIVGRNTFFADATANVDLGLFKSFRLPKGRVMARIELYNAFNHPQFGFPTSDFASASFGRIVGTATAYNPRQLQASFRYIF